MKLAERIIRERAIAECISAIHPLMGEDAGPDAYAMLEKLKALRDEAQATVAGGNPVDYLEMVQLRARKKHIASIDPDKIGREHSATEAVDTPLGELRCMTWKRPWVGDKRPRITWASEYTLAGDFVSVREIKAAGLAARPTSRNRQKRSRDL